MNGGSTQAVPLQLLGQAVGTMLGACEYQYLAPVLGTDHVAQQLPLALFVYRVNHLLDPLGGGVAARHFDKFGAVEQTVGKLLDLAGEGGGEQQVLARAVARQQGKHLADIVNEAHIQHAVGFVQHQDFDLRQIHRLLTGMIEQPARCRHQDIDAAPQLVYLRIDLDPAEDHCRVRVADDGRRFPCSGLPGQPTRGSG